MGEGARQREGEEDSGVKQLSPPRPLTVSFFSGHSGGHLFPAFAAAEAFKRRLPETRIHLLTGAKAGPIVRNLPAGIFDEVCTQPEFPLPTRPSPRVLEFLWEFPRAFIVASHYLSKAKPDICLGFGSYASYPGMLLAAARNIPTLIHEQNLIPGKATARLARRVDVVAVTFPETFRGLDLKRREVTGLPVRAELSSVGAYCNTPLLKITPGEKFRILVTGGSQGARRLNGVLLETFFSFSSAEKEKFAVTHITGRADFDWVTGSYEKSGVAFQTFPFHKRMGELYGQADMAVTRAGAGTLFELALFGLPAVVIPYPHAGAHQAANAKYFESRGAVLYREEADLAPAWLAGQIRTLVQNPNQRKKLSENISELACPNAAEQIVKLALELVNIQVPPLPPGEGKGEGDLKEFPPHLNPLPRGERR